MALLVPPAETVSVPVPPTSRQTLEAWKASVIPASVPAVMDSWPMVQEPARAKEFWGRAAGGVN